MHKKIKIIIILLAVLLAASLTVLSIVLVFKFRGRIHATVAVTNNYISEKMGSPPIFSEGHPNSVAATVTYNTKTVPIAAQNRSTYMAAGSSGGKVELQLYKKHEQDNVPFAVTNMFPGDRIEKNFSVRVIYSKSVTVHFRTDIRPGYEKLAEVLKCRVELTSSGKLLYDGLMRDMPKSVDHSLTAGEKGDDLLNYKITAYLDTSIGNEYQNKDLVADFVWWAESENLRPAPNTGDNSMLTVYMIIGAAALILLILLLCLRRKGDQDEQH